MMMMRLCKCFALILSIILVLPYNLQAQDTVKPGEVLNLERCLQLALSHHPSLQVAADTIRVTQSRIGQAQSNYMPQVNWQTTYSRNAPYSTSPLLPGMGQYDLYGSNIGITQNIYDFQRTPTQVRIAKLNTDVSRRDQDNTTSQVVLTLKQAYYALVQAIKNREVAVETIAQFEQHLAQAKAFFKVGTKPKFDVTKAEVDLGNAKLNLIKADNAVRIAKVNLNNAMGLPNAPNYELDVNLLSQKYDITLDDAVKRAYDGRPDLQSLLLKQESANQSVTLAKAANYPTITGSASYGFGGTQFPVDRGWNVGGTLNVPIFSGLLIQNQIAEAKANLDVVRANIEVLKQQIRLDVEQAYSNLREASDRIVQAQLTVRQAEENMALATGRYSAGVGNPIEVTDALVVRSNAKTSYIAAMTDYKAAQASLEKAMGMK
ncbi:MAG: Outer membrane protein TolC [Syntrophus sp. SKADARSKE-3]|nr:Outer membrane protein TolC [Syntrophus sp. SKADARSKE-3]